MIARMSKAVLLGALLLGVREGAAQASPASATSARAFVYDVASIKVDNSGSNSRHTSTTYDQFSTTNSSLRQMLALAYGIREDLISGIPGAIDSARFDVQAKILDPDEKAWTALAQDQWRAILQPLLMERFKLKLHRETKQLPVYELHVLSSGVKFKPTPAATVQAGAGVHTSGHDDSMALEATSISMAALAQQFAVELQRTVIDNTGLSGKYDLELRWYAEHGGDRPADAPPVLFTAVQDQLGLKLAPAKGPVEVLVVDSVEMPSTN